MNLVALLTHEIECVSGAVHFQMLYEIAVNEFLQNKCGELWVAISIRNQIMFVPRGRLLLTPVKIAGGFSYVWRAFGLGSADRADRTGHLHSQVRTR